MCPALPIITTTSKLFKTINDKPILINVVSIKAAEYNGSKLPVHAQTGFDTDHVLKSAVNKHADYDQHFCDIENYYLMYPDNVPRYENSQNCARDTK